MRKGLMKQETEIPILVFLDGILPLKMRSGKIRFSSLKVTSTKKKTIKMNK